MLVLALERGVEEAPIDGGRRREMVEAMLGESLNESRVEKAPQKA